MKHLALTTMLIFTAASVSAPALAAPYETDIYSENFDPNLMEEIDHNAIPGDASADATIVLPPDPRTVGKPRARSKANRQPAKEIPLIDTSYHGQSSDDVNYVTGGVGKYEREAIEASKADYNVHIVNASTSGAFVADTRIVITRSGSETEEVLDVESGPLLYVRLPAGNYTLIAIQGDQSKEQKLVVSANGKPSSVRLTWRLAQN